MLVAQEIHAAWKSAHALCNVCAGFHVMYIHEIGEEIKLSISGIICVFVSRGRGGGGVLGAKRVSKISKNIYQYLRMTPNEKSHVIFSYPAAIAALASGGVKLGN